jgi:hypothetical protein
MKIIIGASRLLSHRVPFQAVSVTCICPEKRATEFLPKQEFSVAWSTLSETKMTRTTLEGGRHTEGEDEEGGESEEDKRRNKGE